MLIKLYYSIKEPEKLISDKYRFFTTKKLNLKD